MKKKIIAFYDILFFVIVCGPMTVTAIILLFMIAIKGTFQWKCENWYLVVIFAITFMVPQGAIMFFRYYVISDNYIHFHYFPFTTSWAKAANNIDIKWNQNVFISEIKDIKIVKLTKEEMQTKVFYKHWFNKYLKINMKDYNSKYVYVGNYSNYQINKIIRFVEKQLDSTCL